MCEAASMPLPEPAHFNGWSDIRIGLRSAGLILRGCRVVHV